MKNDGTTEVIGTKVKIGTSTNNTQYDPPGFTVSGAKIARPAVGIHELQGAIVKIVAVGQEQASGRYYLSIPVSNGLVGYEEYYEITQQELERFSSALAEMRDLAEQSRAHKLDARMIMKPGARRGAPV